jgi:hypothetical protein
LDLKGFFILFFVYFERFLYPFHYAFIMLF